VRGLRPAVERIGRYQIVKELGAGGMGVVWQAFDPVLRRGVAIKALRDTSTPRLAERLRREAQALAQLSHPNVVTVYDVGEERDELYIVMQLLGGATLADELARPPSLHRVLPLLIQAARGLEAAHAAGIVHRDFKPSNVLVDGDVARVGDFGLSWVSPAELPSGADGNLPTENLTRGVLGTPSYMSPEQHLGQPLTAATDQFSFCVTLWEALVGERPFAGTDLAALREAVTRGPLPEVPSRVPRRLRRVLVRGLARDPGQRYPSMTELLADLAPKRRTAWVAGGAGVVAAAAVVTVLATHHTDGPCHAIGAQADAVWTPAKRASVQAALGPLAPSILAAVDDRVTRWRAERLDACEATHVRHDQPATVLEQRYRCLERQLDELRAGVDLLGKPDPQLKARAHDIVDAVDPSDCGRDRVAKPVAAPRDPRVPALETRAAQAEVARRAGRNDEVIALAKTLSPDVIATGDPTLASHWFQTLGDALAYHGSTTDVKDAYRRAAEAATRAGDDKEAVEAWTDEIIATANAEDLAGVDDMLAMARGAAARSGQPGTEIDLGVAEASIATERGDQKAAVAACQHVIDVIAKTHATGGRALLGLHCLFDEQNHFNDPAAVDTGKQVVARSIEIYGPDHPETLDAQRVLASALALQGDLAGAKPLWDRVLSATEAQFGKDSVAVAYVLRDLAVSETPYGRGSPPEALAAARRAVAIGERQLPATDPRRADLYETLAYLEASNHHEAEQIAAYQRAIELREHLDDPQPLARTLYNLADTYRTHHKCELALPLFRRAATLGTESGKRMQITAMSNAGLAVCAAKAHDWATATPAFTSATDDLEALDQPMYAAITRQNWAELLGADGKRDQARAQAKRALAILKDLPPPADQVRAELTDWLKHN
jgi:tetratricopeptide (TPR) repeat protein